MDAPCSMFAECASASKPPIPAGDCLPYAEGVEPEERHALLALLA